MYSEGIANKFSWYTVSLLDIYMNVSRVPVVVAQAIVSKKKHNLNRN